LSPYKNSVQILYEQHIESSTHGWSVYFGPQGIPVNPCGAFPFSRLHHSVGHVVQGSSIDQPPFPPKEIWKGLPNLYTDTSCEIKGSGSRLPTLECGNILVVDFKEDPGYEEPTITCPDGFRYHRACFTEYTA
ncbi:hypothetical protein BKA66DRAFT_432747, partial [Pyrenochaeta sp. MPI-SDFR-AT-0127]